MFSAWTKWLRGDKCGFTHWGCCMAPNYKAVWSWCWFCVVLTSGWVCLLPLTSFSPHPVIPLQLYHVIWMNLHRESPIWRRRGFRKCLKTTWQQAVSCLWELHWDKLNFKCGSVLVSQLDGAGFKSWHDMYLISTVVILFYFFPKTFLCILFLCF